MYALVVLLFRITGNRGLANLNAFDFVAIFLLSNVVQNAVTGQDISLLSRTIGAATLVATNVVVNRMIARSPLIARLLEGRGSDLIVNGVLDARALRRLAIRPAELDHAVLLQNGDDLSEFQTGRLEPDGQLVLTHCPRASSQRQNLT